MGSFDHIYESYQSMIRSVLYKINGPADLDDLVQDTFLRIWKGLQKFHGQSEIKTWIYRITVNVALDFQRKNKNRPGTLIVDPAQANPKENSSDRYYRELVQKGLGQLSLAHRTVLVLHSMEELGVVEIARVLKTSPGTIKSRLFHARKNMAAYLEKMGVNL